MCSVAGKKTDAIRNDSLATRLGQLMAGVVLLGVAAAVSAAPVAPPLPGYLADAGDSYFSHGDAASGVELADALSPSSTFGFYFQGDPGTLIPIFDSTDVAPPQQTAEIDFANGQVADTDTGPTATPFSTSSDDIGLYFDFNGSTVFSDPLLNGGLDVFSSFQNQLSPLTWLFVFEVELQPGVLTLVSINLIQPLSASAVPLPPTVWLMGSMLPILLLVSRRRKARAQVVA